VTDEELLARADAIAERAYAPYSKFCVGAVIVTRDGRVFEGVNVENASYPLGVCAERTVLSKAATDGLRPGDVEAIAINASPCGGCRQWLHEWKLDRVTYRRVNGDVVTRTPDEILPDSFDL
jgi:cytidine deaminase